MSSIDEIWNQMKKENESNDKKQKIKRESQIISNNTIIRKSNNFEKLPDDIINNSDKILKHIQIYINGLNDENISTKKYKIINNI